jgi:uncharacterized protein (TIGR02145 family)
MKKVLFPLLLILFFTACKKETSPELLSEEIAGTATKGKIAVCHYDKETGTSHTITINENALKAHLAHGDLLGDCSAVLVTICDQDWMVKNLDVSTYRDGTLIPQVTTFAELLAASNAGTGAWLYYNNNPANGAIYGKLYNWYAVNDSRGLAPAGWHIPANAEWVTLSDCLGGAAVAGGKMKTTGTIEDATGLWRAPNTDATNSSGFSALPGGNDLTFAISTTTTSLGYAGIWWSSEQLDATRGYAVALTHSNGTILLPPPIVPKVYGLSVRCVRD